MSKVLQAVTVVGLVTCVGCAARTRDTGTATAPYSPPASTNSATRVNNEDPGTIPVGQEMDVRLRSSLSSETATVEQHFETTTAIDLTQNGRVLVPAGSVVRGIVSGVDKAGRLDRSGALTLSFDRMVVNGREIPIRGTATDVFESEGIRDEGRTAGVGAGVGGLLGGFKGVLVGAVIGAGGAIAATEGKDIVLARLGAILQALIARDVTRTTRSLRLTDRRDAAFSIHAATHAARRGRLVLVLLRE